MTDLHMDNGSTLPAWDIEFPVDLRQWKWQPPTMRSSKKTRKLRKSDSSSGLSWLSKLRTTEEIRLTKEELKQVGSETLVPSATLPERLSKARSAVANSTSEAIQSAFYNFIGGLQQDLKLGVLDVEVVAEAVTTFPQSLIDTATDREVVNAAIEMFLSAVVHGIKSSKVLGPAEFGGIFWNQLLLRISQLQDNDATNSLLQTTLDAVPLERIKYAHEGIVAAVQRLVVSRSTDPGRAADIGFALRKLSTFKHKWLLRKIRAAVHEGSMAIVEGTARRNARFLWLQVLAHMPHIRQEDLWDVCVWLNYFHPSKVAPIGRDLSQLLIQQWASRGYLRRPKVLEDLCNRDAAESEILSLAVLPVNMLSQHVHEVPCLQLLENLFEAVRHFKREKELIESIEKLCATRESLPLAPFVQLAKASGNHRSALMIYSIVKSYQTKFFGFVESRWHWTDWDHYVKDMIMDDSIFVGTVWKLVDLGAVEDSLESGRQKEQLRKRRNQLFANMAVWFSKASHLSDTQAKRNVGRCVLRLHKQGEDLPDKVIKAVVLVVTRELKRGEAGRTNRIRWMLGLLERYKGSAERREVQRVLQRWREINEELMTRGRDGMIGGPR